MWVFLSFSLISLGLECSPASLPLRHTGSQQTGLIFLCWNAPSVTLSRFGAAFYPCWNKTELLFVGWNAFLSPSTFTCTQFQITSSGPWNHCCCSRLHKSWHGIVLPPAPLQAVSLFPPPSTLPPPNLWPPPPRHHLLLPCLPSFVLTLFSVSDARKLPVKKQKHQNHWTI